MYVEQLFKQNIHKSSIFYFLFFILNNIKMSKKPQAGIALLLSFFLGLFGADKFYIGRPDLGVLQIILTITFIGLAVNIPWVLLSILSLFIFIFLGGMPFMYSGVEWAQITNTDKIIAGCLLVFLLITYMMRKPTTTIQNYDNACPVCHKNPFNCNKEKYLSDSSGCSSCSRGMVPPS
jgi:TM2 domain-containing membrane protein YozV